MSDSAILNPHVYPDGMLIEWPLCSSQSAMMSFSIVPNFIAALGMQLHMHFGLYVGSARCGSICTHY